MVNVRADLEDCFIKSKTMPRTTSSHHFVQISSNKIARKLTSEESFVNSISTTHWPKKIAIKNIKCFSYLCCIYDTLWWVGTVTEVNVHQSDLKIEFLHPYGPRKTFSRPSAAALYQSHTFYALSQLQQQLLGECIRSQTLTLNKL